MRFSEWNIEEVTLHGQTGFRKQRPVLLSGQDRVFRSLGHARLHNLLGFDLDHLACGRVVPGTDFALDQHQFANARQSEDILQNEDRFDLQKMLDF